MDRGRRSRNVAAWLGPLLVVLGVLSYYTVLVPVFARWPVLRDAPVVNLVVIAAGLVLAVVGFRRTRGRGGWRRAGSGAGLALSSAAAALFVWYSFVFSYRLPAADGALAVGARVPALTLVGHDGAPVDLLAASAGSAVLVFYRGFW
jgi:FtsH-binding integral membrane protein